MHTLEAKGVDLIISLRVLWCCEAIMLKETAWYLNLMFLS